MEVVAGAAVVVSRLMVGAVLAVVVTTSRHIPYKLHAPAACDLCERRSKPRCYFPGWTGALFVLPLTARCTPEYMT